MTTPLPSPPEKPVPRWQAEIEEILESSDRETTSFEKARAAAIATRYKAPDRAKQATERASTQLSDGAWLLFALILGVVGWLVGLHMPIAGRILAMASLLLFAAFLVNAVVRSRKSKSSPKLWRGQDLNSSNPPRWRPGRHWPSHKDDDDPPLVGSGR